MAKKKKTAIGDLSEVELKEMSHTLSAEIFEMKNTLAIQRKLEKPHLLKDKRKERARVLTLLTQKQMKSVAV